MGPLIAETSLALGAQDCSPEKQGAFTGDISALMLRDAGCRYVILGHSERRQLHGETSLLIQRKAIAALDAGLIPVICVGEQLRDRESGAYKDIILSQVRESMPENTPPTAVILAYEPVWAIGTGLTASPAQIEEVHKTIASSLTYGTSGARAPILYGGSVKAAGAKEILNTPGVDGVLVGGASLKPEEFSAIIAASG